jgi:NAD(P)-dependent dehydrogenase (short-subunit alcohol dehydrogenase family)
MERVVLITGGAEGIGRATARRLAAEGWRLALADVDEAAGGRTQAELREAGAEVVFLPCDVREEEQVRGAVTAAADRFGALHALVNAAGILQGAFHAVEELETETFDRVLDVNLRGTFLACKHAVPVIEASGGGVVLCIASGGGVRGPSSSLAYGASKAGMHGFCLTLEAQLKPRGIRVNVVCPGTIDTNMKRRNVRDAAAHRGEDPEAALAAAELGDPDGVARVLAFLASPAADYVVGTVFTR